MSNSNHLDPSKRLQQQKKQRRIFTLLALLVVLLIGGALWQFGQTSPVIASGEVILPAELAPKAQALHTLFIVVSDAESGASMPYGAFRANLSQVPAAGGRVYEFLLTAENLRVMMEGTPPPRNMRLKARLDGDGQGGPDQPGDLIGMIENIAPGSKNVAITIAKEIPAL